jgi:hypothetical protein
VDAGVLTYEQQTIDDVLDSMRVMWEREIQFQMKKMAIKKLNSH